MPIIFLPQTDFACAVLEQFCDAPNNTTHSRDLDCPEGRFQSNRSQEGEISEVRRKHGWLSGRCADKKKVD